MLQSLVRIFRKSMASPMKVVTASFEGLQERNEWIRKNRVLASLELPNGGGKGSGAEEIIRILGTDYDSLEALLAITIETVDDRLKGTRVEKDDILYRTTAELTLVSRFLAEGKSRYAYGRVLLAEIRAEKDRRNQEDYLGRSKGLCCSASSISGRFCGCEKWTPERWEVGRSVLN